MPVGLGIAARACCTGMGRLYVVLHHPSLAGCGGWCSSRTLVLHITDSTTGLLTLPLCPANLVPCKNGAPAWLIG